MLDEEDKNVLAELKNTEADSTSNHVRPPKTRVRLEPQKWGLETWFGLGCWETRLPERLNWKQKHLVASFDV